MWRNGERVDFADYCIDRKDPTENQLKILLEEVHGLCPISECGKSLVNIKNGRYIINMKSLMFSLVIQMIFRN